MSRYSRRSSVLEFAPLFIIVPVVLIIIVSIVVGIGQVTTRGNASHCLVTDKDRTRDSQSNSSDMRVYTQNCGTFKVADTIIGKVNFNSADLYSSLQVGHTYDFTTRGKRIGFLSQFTLIFTATEV